MAVNAALVRAIYPSRLLGRGVAINSLVVATGSVAGPSIAALILSVASWPFLFLVNLPVGAIALFVGLRALPANVSPPAAGLSLRVSDVVMNAAMFGLVFLGAEAIGTQGSLAGFGWRGGSALMAAGAVVGVLYVRSQWRRAVPMLPIDLLRIPVFAWSMCASVTAFAAQTLAYIALPFLFLGAYQRSHTQAGLLITAWPLGVVLAAPVAGRLIGRYPDGLLGGIGMAAMATGLTALGMAARAPDEPRHRVAHGDLRHRLRPLPVAEQPHHRHERAAASVGRCERHARHGPTDRPDGRRRAARDAVRRVGRAGWPGIDHRARRRGGVGGGGWGVQFDAVAGDGYRAFDDGRCAVMAMGRGACSVSVRTEWPPRPKSMSYCAINHRAGDDDFQAKAIPALDAPTTRRPHL